MTSLGRHSPSQLGYHRTGALPLPTAQTPSPPSASLTVNSGLGFLTFPGSLPASLAPTQSQERAGDGLQWHLHCGVLLTPLAVGPVRHCPGSPETARGLQTGRGAPPSCSPPPPASGCAPIMSPGYDTPAGGGETPVQPQGLLALTGRPEVQEDCDGVASPRLG